MKRVDNTSKVYERLVDSIEGLKLKKSGYHPSVGFYELLSAVTEREIPKRFLWITWTKTKQVETNLLLVIDNHRVEIAAEDDETFGDRIESILEGFERDHGVELTYIISDNLMHLPTPAKEKAKK